MDKNVIIVNKKVGQTPLDCINNLKEENKELIHLPITYAGRLDPLAEGVLVLLIGDECLKKDEYLNLTKEYELTILFGFATDTYDVMGKVSQTVLNSSFSGFVQNIEIEKVLKNFIGRIKQLYPPYSSRTVDGKPLYKWAREGRLGEIEIPSHDVFVEGIKIIKEDFISGKNLLIKIKDDIAKVKGDFRQDEILNIWDDVLKDKEEENFKTIKLKISCGSGVYVRCIAHELGKSLGVSGLALNIKRTKVGEYTI